MSRKRPPQTRSRSAIVVFWLAALGVLAVAVILFARPYLGTSRAQEEGTRINISMSGWQPGAIRAEAGKPVTVTVVNLDNQFHTDGGGWHSFVVEELGVAERVGPKQTGTFSFVASEPGEYLFYCDVCCGGKDNPFMQGKLIVS